MPLLTSKASFLTWKTSFSTSKSMFGRSKLVFERPKTKNGLDIQNNLERQKLVQMPKNVFWTSKKNRRPKKGYRTSQTWLGRPKHFWDDENVFWTSKQGVQNVFGRFGLDCLLETADPTVDISPSQRATCAPRLKSALPTTGFVLENDTDSDTCLSKQNTTGQLIREGHWATA